MGMGMGGVGLKVDIWGFGHKGWGGVGGGLMGCVCLWVLGWGGVRLFV